MPRRELTLSGYSGMWLFALFDLPVKTKRDRKRYAQFRAKLLSEGFSMLQFSVYARYCSGEDMSDSLRDRVRKVIPQEGQVRLMSITDRQFGKQEVFFGKRSRAVEEAPSQLVLF